MEIKMLRPKSEDSQRLVDWVEEGLASNIAAGPLSMPVQVESLVNLCPILMPGVFLAEALV